MDENETTAKALHGALAGRRQLSWPAYCLTRKCYCRVAVVWLVFLRNGLALKNAFPVAVCWICS